MPPVLIDKLCGKIGEIFMQRVNGSKVLEEYPSLGIGSHELIMKELSVNAAAGRTLTGKPSYQYYLGSALALWDAACTVASSPAFHPELPCPAGTVEKHKEIAANSFVSYDYLKSSSPNSVIRFHPHLEPKDKERFALAYILFELSTNYIAMHEQAHYFRGHLHYLYSAKSLSLQEIPGGGQRQAEPSLLRALELDADGLAVASAFSDLIHFPEIHNPENVASSVIRTTEDLVRISMVAFACLFAVLARADRTHTLKDATHPSSAVRLLNAWGIYVYALHRELGREAHIADSLLHSTIEDIEVVLNVLGGPQLKRSHLEYSMTKTLPRHRDELFDEFLDISAEKKKIKPIIDPFSDSIIEEIIRVGSHAQKPEQGSVQ